MAAFEFLLNPPARQLATSSALLNGIASNYRVDGYRTTLSLKAVQRGAAIYTTPRSRHLVTEDCFLILNCGQEYSLEFQWPTPTETLCPFFQPGFVEHVAYSMTVPARRQLDEIDVGTRPVDFCERLYPRTGCVGHTLDMIHRGLRAGHVCGTWLEDQFHNLAEELVELRGVVRREVDQIAAHRASTREELYRRLHRSRDFLSSCYAEPITVAKAAAVAALSPYHFHRQFKSMFGETPMQFLQARRLDAARRLLLTTDMPVTQVCFSVGFESLGSFSSLFQKRFSCSPLRFRRAGKLR